MKDRILAYRKKVDTLIQNEPSDTDWQAVLQEHLVQVAFFQHERLIHLLVTLTFALLTLFSMIAALVLQGIGLLLLCLLLLCLLLPYILHYYLLENEVQKMYAQYDELRKRAAHTAQNTAD